MRVIQNPMSVEEVEFTPRIVKQTTLFPIDKEMQRVLIELRKTQKDFFFNMWEKCEGSPNIIPGPWTLLSQVSFFDDIRKGKYSLYSRERKEELTKKAEELSVNAKNVLEAVLEAVRPYVNGLKYLGNLPTPELNWKHKRADIEYKFHVRFSEHRDLLIVSPVMTLYRISWKTEYDASGKALRHHIQGPFTMINNSDGDRRYSQIFGALLKGKHQAFTQTRHIYMDYGIPEIATSLIPVSQLDLAMEDFSKFCHDVLAQSDEFYRRVNNISDGSGLSRIKCGSGLEQFLM